VLLSSGIAVTKKGLESCTFSSVSGKKQKDNRWGSSEKGVKSDKLLFWQTVAQGGE